MQGTASCRSPASIFVSSNSVKLWENEIGKSSLRKHLEMFSQLSVFQCLRSFLNYLWFSFSGDIIARILPHMLDRPRRRSEKDATQAKISPMFFILIGDIIWGNRRPQIRHVTMESLAAMLGFARLTGKLFPMGCKWIWHPCRARQRKLSKLGIPFVGKNNLRV